MHKNKIQLGFKNFYWKISYSCCRLQSNRWTRMKEFSLVKEIMAGDLFIVRFSMHNRYLSLISISMPVRNGTSQRMTVKNVGSALKCTMTRLTFILRVKTSVRN